MNAQSIFRVQIRKGFFKDYYLDIPDKPLDITRPIALNVIYLKNGLIKKLVNEKLNYKMGV